MATFWRHLVLKMLIFSLTLMWLKFGYDTSELIRCESLSCKQDMMTPPIRMLRLLPHPTMFITHHHCNQFILFTVIRTAFQCK